ncbi:hypothetical protein LEP1GSC081_2367 [Leptospira kirschneri str. H1]|uniref:Uncharacterized protein n=1 Tax=Leptospira kirschneri str. H1 TaxID=1049966 RepID=A0A0E2B845_9LEPT|nr:hypothetical protein LEP1GSC081_2367 [Leptospira kirschneri str. H1]
MFVKSRFAVVPTSFLLTNLSFVIVPTLGYYRFNYYKLLSF